MSLHFAKTSGDIPSYLARRSCRAFFISNLTDFTPQESLNKEFSIYPFIAYNQIQGICQKKVTFDTP